MAKSKERLKARSLRQNGYSVKTISKLLKVSRSSVSIWVRDIQLTPQQLRQLNQNSLDGRAKGRTMTSKMYQIRRECIRQQSLESGLRRLGNLTQRDLFITGLALYWGEGNKKTKEVRLTNSDPAVIKIALLWFKRCFNIPISQLIAFVGINASHHDRESEIIKYWSGLTSIPLSQFRKSIIKKSASKKIYLNRDQYYGTLSIRVLKGTIIHYQIQGLIEALGQTHFQV
jgi:predicted transcriptional regulator